MMKKGFTLIELMTALSIFIIVMTISMGSILGAFDANRKSRSLKSVMNNLNLAVESMSREMRYGQTYHCGSGDVTLPQNCPEGGTLVSFLSSEAEQITYRLNGTALERRVGEGDYVAVTAPEVVIDDLTFYVLGTDPEDTLQPKILIKIESHAGSGRGRSDFTLQTMVSQRPLDISSSLAYAYPTPAYTYPTPVTCTPGSQTFSYTGSNQTFTVPSGCTSITIKAWGAGGGGASQGGAYPYVTTGGGGGYASGVLAVSPGQQLTVIVGQGGGGVGNFGFTPFGGGTAAGGIFYSGGGGGRSAVRLSGGTEVITAGAGGGGGYGNYSMVAAVGGGSTGGQAMASLSLDGAGGTQSAGGAGGVASSGNGTAGSQFQGGGGPGGGGGGGYFGGGGGGLESGGCSCGGGGGSSYAGGVFSGSTISGSGATPANSGDANYVAGVGVGGAIGSTSAWVQGGDGGNGLVHISW